MPKTIIASRKLILFLDENLGMAKRTVEKGKLYTCETIFLCAVPYLKGLKGKKLILEREKGTMNSTSSTF